MANYSYTSSNIQFIINDDAGLAKLPSKYGNSNAWDRIDSGKATSIKPFVNAVEIDWNGAQLGADTTINTTGELLSYISTIANNGGGSNISLSSTDTTIDFSSEAFSGSSDKIFTLSTITSADDGKTYTIENKRFDFSYFNTLGDEINNIKKSSHTIAIETGSNVSLGETVGTDGNLINSITVSTVSQGDDGMSYYATNKSIDFTYLINKINNLEKELTYYKNKTDIVIDALVNL